jgi:uncharacterized membrane protein SirB2
MYLILKHLHMTMAGLSFIGFFIRGIWMWQQSPLLQKKLVKILPHIIDTLLLVSAFALAITLKYTPGAHPWLMTKIVLLVVYIILGIIAFKNANPRVRKLSWLVALVVFIYIFSVAMTKNPLGFLG